MKNSNMVEDSSFIQALTAGGTQRIKESRLRHLINEINKKYSDTAPRGCSLNTKAQFKDIDKAIEASRAHERSFDHYAKSPIQSRHNRAGSLPGKRYSQKNKRLEENGADQIHIKIRDKFLFTSILKKSAQASPSASNSINSDRNEYPERFKSIPLHKDPNYRLRTARNSEFKSNRRENLDKFEDFSNFCDNLDLGSKKLKNKINGTINLCKDIDRSMLTWADDLSKISKLAKNPREQTKLMKQRKGAYSTDDNYMEHSKVEVKKDIAKMTEKINALGPTKIWRQNYRVFIRPINLRIASFNDEKS